MTRHHIQVYCRLYKISTDSHDSWSELGAILNAPALKIGDANAFDSFAFSVQSLVGMLKTLEGQNGYELHCGSHVDRLLSKMAPTYCDSFVEHCL